MKKSIKITMILLIFSFSLVFANSGPVFWQGYPSSDIMTVDRNSPIEVKSENLIFDFSEESNDSYSIQANVTAEYEMTNPTDETQSVQMAKRFPMRFMQAKLLIAMETVLKKIKMRTLILMKS